MYKAKDILEYIIALVNEFAKRFCITDTQAYRYIKFHKGIGFIEENYKIIHTLDFSEAVDSVVLFCRKKGGSLRFCSMDPSLRFLKSTLANQNLTKTLAKKKQYLVSREYNKLWILVLNIRKRLLQLILQMH